MKEGQIVFEGTIWPAKTAARCYTRRSILRKPLRPLPISRNTPLKLRRLAAHAKGWPIIPSQNKSQVPPGWTTMPNDAEAIAAWDNPRGGHKDYKGTGIRLQDDMFVVDVDIPDPKLFKKVLRAFRKRWPAWFKGAIERSSGAVKRAYFGRISQPYKQSQTHKYTADRTLLAELTREGISKEERRLAWPLFCV
jgi:hypothetical protein